jgi:hypothetical protein
VTRTPLRFAEDEALALDLRESCPSLEAAPHALHPTFVNLLAADHLRVDVLQRVLSYVFLQNATIYILVEQARSLWGNRIGLARPRLSDVEGATATGGTFRASYQHRANGQSSRCAVVIYLSAYGSTGEA